ncbi:MAG: hypothetical protein M1829_000896 [Trizodia sp. TS-e1964]|nr:MAG: hypothetical protein M1829_000896 [Trizodia sp. TS-e1964]
MAPSATLLPQAFMSSAGEGQSHAQFQAENPKYWRCAILGCTGAVGQRLIELLAHHPYIKIDGLGAFPRSAGKPYREAVHRLQSSPIHPGIANMVVQECVPKNFLHCHLVFSALASTAACDIEREFMQAKFPIFSNAKNHRQEPIVLLMIPTLNLEHMSVIRFQREVMGCGGGFVVCSPSCSVAGVALPIRAMEDMLKCKVVEANVITMQAISSGGHPGVDMLDNVVPFIPDEEARLEKETRKVLGTVYSEEDGFTKHFLGVSAACNRVQVLDGHTTCVSVMFDRTPRVSAEEVKSALREWQCHPSVISCPSAPRSPIIVLNDENRPQPRLDRNQEAGMAVSVGRVREDKTGYFDIMFASLSHNAVLGAAGASILNAEVAIRDGWVE